MRTLLKPRVALKTYLPNSEREIEEAARVCWGSWGKSDGTLQGAKDMIGRLHKVGHIDTLEESFMSVWIECSRPCANQIVRHRTFHFLQASQRYIKADEPEFLIPPSIHENPEVESHFIGNRVEEWKEYAWLREQGIRAEDARYCLPGATLTKLKASANWNNWRKFFWLRSDQTAQWEVRMVSNAILEMAYELAPSVFEDQYEHFIVNGKIEPLFADFTDRSEFDNTENWVLDPDDEIRFPAIYLGVNDIEGEF